MPPELGVAELPPAARALYSTWREIASARGSNGFGPSPITWSEINAWQSLCGVCLSPWEVQLMRELDAVELSASSEDHGI
jgi:hypothetical protein